MTSRLFIAFIGLMLLMGSGHPGAQQRSAAQPPRFSSAVEVTSVDVAVVDGQGKPLAGLEPADFSVRVDGKSRRVVSAEWVPLAVASSQAKTIVVPEGYSSNENSVGGRLIALAVDEPHIRPGGAAAVLAAANAFIDRLSPADRVAAISLGLGGAATPFVADRERIKEAIGRMAGQRETLRTFLLTISATEALEIDDGNRLTAEQVVARECAGLRSGSSQFVQCRQEVEVEANQLADQVKRSSDLTIRNLREVLRAMQSLDGPKTLILMSEGFTVLDAGLTSELGALAAATRTSIYALKLDNQLFDISNSGRVQANDPRFNVRFEGLEALADAARGTIFNVTGTGSQLFAHIESELSGYYLLGVESDPGDRDGRPHAIRIDVSRRGATVRTRRQLLNVPADLARPKSPGEAVAASLTAPLLMSALPLRIATFALRAPDARKVQLLIRAEVGTDYAAAKAAAVGYVIQDRRGQVVENRTLNATLVPVMNGVPGPLQFAAGASLDPGEYTIKLAVAEGDRVGSVEHPVHAGLVDLGEVRLSELMVGGPADTRDLLHPTVGHTVSFGVVHGYLEAYGSHLDQMDATYEIAAAADGPALITSDVPGRSASADRVLFTEALPVSRLPPGDYVLRAHVRSSGEVIKTFTRPFQIAPPAVLMTSAAAAPAPSAAIDLFLPVDEGLFARRFAREEALRPQTVEFFLQRVPGPTKGDFEHGIEELKNANLSGAETSFKRAIRPDVDSTAALAYLAASMASAGRDADAASAWQTALIDGSDLPQIYEWLGDTFVRIRDYSAARSILEEALGRWPADTRFNRTLAISYATLGKGRDAIRVLDRYIADGHADPDLLFLMVEWIYQVHNNRAVVTNPAADLTMARNYAAQYAKANGPKQALVQQWIGFLEKQKP
jgi:VWFA-related protein